MVVPLWPGWIPGRPFWVYLVGTILIVGGGAVIFRIKARLAATLLAGLFLLSLVLLHIPANVMADVNRLGGRTGARPIVRAFGSNRPAHSFFSGVGRASRISRVEFPIHAGVFDLAEPGGCTRFRIRRCCLPSR